MDLLPQYDEIWIVSDLHMGGERSAVTNFQILGHGDRLARLIHRLARDRGGDEVALILNGDVIDSLAEEVVPGYVALDVETALTMLQRISRDPSFAAVWDALGAFVHTAKRHLVIIIGNHDIELALDPVQAWIRDHLAGGDPTAAARIRFSTGGAGFACRVGGRRVFCTHGNEVDAWNTVDYDALGQLGNALNAGRRVDAAAWVPNAGTRMVIDLMNRVKKTYPFVDLLKPETKPVLGTLLTLDPSLVKLIDLGPAYRVVRELMRGSAEVKNLLGAGDLEQAPPECLAAAALQEVLGENLATEVRREMRDDGERSMLLKAESALREPRAAVGSSKDPETLGWGDVIRGWLGRVPAAEALRRALQDWLSGDTTFDLDVRDETFTKIVERVGPGVDFIVTGHTHLARAIEFAPGRHYFNCGTWIRLLRLSEAVLESPTAFAQVFAAFEQHSMEALDAATIPGRDGTVLPLVLDRTNAVQIARDGVTVRGTLWKVVDSPDGSTVDYVEEKGGVNE